MQLEAGRPSTAGSRARWTAASTRALAILALALGGVWPAAPAQARGETRIHDRRDVEGLEFRDRRARRAARREARLAFRARGRRFEIDLEENRGLMAALPAARRERMRRRHEVFRGALAGRPDSWVRLTRSGARWRGLVFDGQELMALEPGVRGGPPSLYRLRDVAVDGSCAVDPHDESLPSMAGLVDELGEDPGALPPALRAASSQLDVALVADRFFVQEVPDPEGTALAILNGVDGIYSEQLGVSLRVVELQLLSQDQGLTSTDASTLLGQLSSYTRLGNVQNPGLVHLLTGRNLNGSTIGIAYLNVLCNSRFGVGLSEMLGSSLGATTVLVAHELGHNFGAPHDNQGGSVCASTPSGFIMNPSLISSADSFSSCSLDQMALEVAGATCLSEIAEPEVPACSNGIDDDGDGLIDELEDPGCSGPDDTDEIEECADGLDNDGDGLIDFGQDPECLAAEQWSETDPRCGFGFEIAPVLLALMVRRRRARRAAA